MRSTSSTVGWIASMVPSRSTKITFPAAFSIPYTAIQISHLLFYFSYLLFSGKYDIWIELNVYMLNIQTVAQREKVCGCIVEYPMLINIFAFDV